MDTAKLHPKPYLLCYVLHPTTLTMLTMLQDILQPATNHAISCNLPRISHAVSITLLRFFYLNLFTQAPQK